MAPFRWPLTAHDKMLAKEVATRRCSKTEDYEPIASILSKQFSTEDKLVVLSGRGCKERMVRLLQKYKDEDKKSLKKSGTEEEYDELHQLLEDIYTFTRDMEEQKANEQREKKKKKRKEADDKKKGEEMRTAALKGMIKCKKGNEDISDSEHDGYSDSDNEIASSSKEANRGQKRKKVQQRASKRSAIDMLTEKNSQKAELKKEELELRRMELEFQKEKYAAEANERNARLEVEMQERRANVNLLKDRL